jgi:uncharacterized protein (DUF2141 family)
MRIVSTLLLVALASIITACPAKPVSVGILVVKITGLTGVAPDVTVSSPNKFSQTITDVGSTSTTISNLPVGSYSIVANDVSPNGKAYTATVEEGSPVNVTVDATTTVNVVYAVAQ